MKPFSLDLRALALWRMALGAVVLLDIVMRATDLQAFYGDDGVLSRALYFEQSWQYPGFHLFLASGSTAGLLALFAVWAVAAFCLMVGYRPRIAGLVTWYFVASIQIRNPMVMDGGDDLLRLLLFWTPFLPLGARWSWDARSFPQWKALSNSYRSVATVALYTQLFVLYFFAAFLKTGDDWLKTGDALFMALSLDQFATPVSKFLLSFPELLRFMTWFALGWEYGLALLLLLGSRWPKIRGLFCLLGFGFHLSIFVMLDFGIFMVISAAGLLAFLPLELLDKEKETSPAVELPKPLPSGYRLERPLQLFGVFIIVMIWVFNLHSVKNIQKVPRWSKQVVLWTYEQQHWHLFAPFPYREDGWFVLEVEHPDNTTTDAWQNGVRSGSRPSNIAASFPNHRWRRWLQNLYQVSKAENESWRRSTLKYVALEWKMQHPDEDVRRFRLVWMREINQPPGVALAPPERVVLAEMSGVGPKRKPPIGAKGQRP